MFEYQNAVAAAAIPTTPSSPIVSLRLSRADFEGSPIGLKNDGGINVRQGPTNTQSRNNPTATAAVPNTPVRRLPNPYSMCSPTLTRNDTTPIARMIAPQITPVHGAHEKSRRTAYAPAAASAPMPRTNAPKT